MKAEMEMAMKLLEKDVHEKQDTIIHLRDQLEDIKSINLEMYTKLQVTITNTIGLFPQATGEKSYLVFSAKKSYFYS